MKNKISKILCFSSLLMIGGNKVLSMEAPKEEKEKPKEEGPKEEGPKEGEPKEGEEENPKGGEDKEDDNKVPPQQPKQGGGNGEDFETLKKEVDEIEKNTHPESEKITLVQFCSGQN